MQTLRVRIKEKLYKEVEKKGPLVIVRWDASKENTNIPSKKKGEEPITKDTGYLVCTERVYRATPSLELLTKDIEEDINIRYKGEKPVIDIDSIYHAIHDNEE